MTDYASTINEIFLSTVERNLERVALYKRGDHWLPISSRDLYRNVMGVARALCRWGVGPGDRVALLSENRPEWAVADFATLVLGAADVPIYTTMTAEQTAFVLNDAAARVAFVSTQDQLRKVLSIRAHTQLEHIVVMDKVTGGGAVLMSELMESGPGERDPGFDARARAVQPDDLATIIYTSGTTGRAKGVMLTHYNLASNLRHSLELFALAPQQVGISFLPLSHITARHLDYVLYQYGVTVTYCPRMEDLPQALREVRPTIFVGVPRVYEKTYNTVMTATARGLKRAIYRFAERVGERHLDQVLAGDTPRSLSWRLANALLYHRIRDGFGGRVAMFISGGAPLGRDLARWYALMGIRIHEGYGLTETSPVIAVNSPDHHKLGTVGKVLPNLEVKIADDGEILVRGPSVFKGYWNLPEESAGAFLDGWFKTGDIGFLDAEGYLTITDRKKDLIKTSGGKFIAPQPIETALKTNVLINQAVVIGDRRKFVCVVIEPHFPVLEDWARANGVVFSSREQLVADPRVRALYEGIVADLNQRLARFETLKKVLVLPGELTTSGGELTPTMKLRRRVVEEKYREQIEALYAEPVSSEGVAVG